jgi:hypothetical protein
VIDYNEAWKNEPFDQSDPTDKMALDMGLQLRVNSYGLRMYVKEGRDMRGRKTQQEITVDDLLLGRF